MVPENSTLPFFFFILKVGTMSQKLFISDKWHSKIVRIMSETTGKTKFGGTEMWEIDYWSMKQC